MKRHLVVGLILLSLLAAVVSAPAAMAGKEIYDLKLAESAAGMDYAFTCTQYPYLLLQYKTSDESGKLVLTGADGLFTGTVPLAHRQTAKQVRVEIKTPSGRSLLTTSEQINKSTKPAARNPEKGAAVKVSGLTLIPGEKQMGFRVSAPGHHQLIVSVSSVMQKAEYVLEEQEDSVFEDTILLPCVNAKDLITVTLKSIKGKELAKASERVLFVPPDVDYVAEEGPLKGVKVCIDPGHQGLQVKAGKVYQYPGSTKRVSGGDSTMAQGTVTLRKESICVLEISYRICRMMRELGADVVMTRWSEEVSVTNMERANYANDQQADYCLRIHLNNSSEGTNNAIYVYGPSNSPYAREALPIEQYRDTAQTILNAMKASTGVQGGIVRMSDQFVGNNWAKMPTFLLECGFLSTPANDWILTTDDYQEKIARGITNGLVAVVEGRLDKFEWHK